MVGEFIYNRFTTIISYLALIEFMYLYILAVGMDLEGCIAVTLPPWEVLLEDCPLVCTTLLTYEIIQ